MNRRAFLAGTAALVLAPDAFARRRGGGTPTALVTADLESRVVAVELASGRVRRTIGTPPGPRAIETCGDVALVAHTEYGFVSIVEAATLRLRRVVGGLSQPRYAAAAGSDHAFVTDSKDGQVVVVDVRRGRVVGRVDVGGPARHISYDPFRELVWTALGSKADEIAVVDVASFTRPRLVRRFRAPFPAHDVGFAGTRVWVTSGAERKIAVYPRQGRPTLIAADAGPQHVTFVGGHAFVTSGDSGTLRVHDARSGRLLRTSRIPTGSYNVQAAFGGAVTPSLSRGTLAIVDGSGRVVRTVRVARSSHDACWVMSA